MLGVVGVGGDAQGERGAGAGFAPEVDFAAVVGGDVFDDGQSQAGAAGGPGAGLVDAKEAFEDALLVFGVDAQAAVGDGDFDVGAVRAGLEAAADGYRGSGWEYDTALSSRLDSAVISKVASPWSSSPVGGSAVMRML